ncbi:MAG: hypothetical protein HY877_05950 [Deltaproteobacteria bacterium]|nr:hypothetical protein [Deltaproteobacteria bacterium]
MGLTLKWIHPSAMIHPLGLHGQHQKTNAALALCAAQELLPEIKLESVFVEALLKTKWPGRLQYIQCIPNNVIPAKAGIQNLLKILDSRFRGNDKSGVFKDALQKNPPVLIDGAHNLAGIQALSDYLKDAHPKTKIHFLLGVLKDKNWQEMFLPLVPLAQSFSCVTPVSKRALPAKELTAHLRQHCSKPVFSLEEPIKFSSVIPAKAGIQSDPNLLGDDSVLVATGSLYMVGEILQYVSTNTIETT